MKPLTIVRTLRKIGKKKVRFIILFGSVAAGKHTPCSDIDIAVYYEGSKKERFQFRLKALAQFSAPVDLHIFQDLPVAVRKEVIAGKVLYYDDFQFIFDQFIAVIKEYDSFEKYYREYLQELQKEVVV